MGEAPPVGNFALKWEKFVHAMIDNGGYRTVLLGLRNTVLVAVVGLIIGIAIGTILAAVEVMPKYKRLPRVLNKICQLYVAFSAAHRWWFSFWWDILSCGRCSV